jgi:hypothetical protein
VGLGTLALLLSVLEAAHAWRLGHAVSSRLARARQEVEEQRARVQEMERRRGPEEGVSAQAVLTLEAPPPRVVAELGALLPPDVKLDGLSLDYGARLALEMQVSARHGGSYDAFLARLENSPLFADVLPGDENRAGEVRATVRARYRGAGE